MKKPKISMMLSARRRGHIGMVDDDDFMPVVIEAYVPALDKPLQSKRKAKPKRRSKNKGRKVTKTIEKILLANPSLLFSKGLATPTDRTFATYKSKFNKAGLPLAKAREAMAARRAWHKQNLKPSESLQAVLKDDADFRKLIQAIEKKWPGFNFPLLTKAQRAKLNSLRRL